MPGSQNFAKALARSQQQPVATFNALCELAHDLFGIKLFTLTEVDPVRREARRIYSNMPDAYPVQGTKPMTDDPWSEQVLVRHQTFAANSIKAIADVFPDYELINALGCQSVINIPVVVGGQVLGTINCLHETGHFSSERLIRSQELKVPGAVAFLLNKSKFFQGDH